MCRRITCSTCAKPGWAGCGAHVEQVLGDIAVADRCQCKAVARQSNDAGATKRGFLARLLGR